MPFYPGYAGGYQRNNGYAAGLMRKRITVPVYAGTQGRLMASMARAGTSRGAAFTARRFNRAAGSGADPRLMQIDNGRPAKGGMSRPGAFVRQLKALVAGKRKDAADVRRDTGAQTTTTVACLTSTTAFATAASGTGLLDMDGDEALINTVTINQDIANYAQLQLDPSADSDTLLRTIIVWFYKPLLVASAAGTLPPVTEVLVTDAVSSLVVPDTQNSGRFTVLYDKVENYGANTFTVAATGAYPRINGVNERCKTFTVKVNKSSHFRVAGVSGAPSGHYDSDVTAGQIDKGLLVMYTLVEIDYAKAIQVNCVTRLNYTG